MKPPLPADQRPTAFVGMPFGDPEADVAFWERCNAVFSVIEAACKRLGVRAVRVDRETFGTSGVVDAIQKYIRDATYCIFDLTSNRPSVLQEIGFAQGVGFNPKQMLIIAPRRTNFAFNVRHLAVQVFDESRGSLADLRSMLNTRLGAIVRRHEEARRLEAESAIPDPLEAAVPLHNAFQTISRRRNDFRKFICVRLIDQWLAAANALTSTHIHRQGPPEEYVEAVGDLIRAPADSIVALCGGKPWPPPLVQRYYAMNYKFAADYSTGKDDVRVTRVFVMPNGGFSATQASIIAQHAAREMHGIRALIVRGDNSGLRMIPNVARDLVRRGFGFAAITTPDGKTAVLAHRGSLPSKKRGFESPQREDQRFRWSRFDEPQVVGEILRIYRGLMHTSIDANSDAAPTNVRKAIAALQRGNARSSRRARGVHD